MTSSKKIKDIVWDIYRDLYAHSEPQGDFDMLVDNAPIMDDGRKYIPYDDYEIEQDVMMEIINRHLSLHKLRKIDKQSIRASILLGCSPKTKIKHE